MAVLDAAEALSGAIEALGTKAQGSAAHIQLLVQSLLATQVGRDPHGFGGGPLTLARQTALLSHLMTSDVFQNEDFLRRLAAELGRRLDSFDVIKVLQDAINRGEAQPFLAAFERAVFGNNKPVRALP